MGWVQNSPLWITQDKQRLMVHGDAKTVQKIPHFFRFDDNLTQIATKWSKDRLFMKAYHAFPGLRLIRQEPWSCMAGFILSIMSNIPKIELSLDKLSAYAGKAVDFQGIKLRTFPTAPEIAEISETTLRSFGMGFRARYLSACAKQVATGFSLEKLRKLPYPDAKEALLQLFGIGEKVADCILLFGLGHLEAFPVDVWMQRILQEGYFDGKDKTAKYLSLWGREHFGAHAGYAQQYLYTYGRRKLMRKGRAILSNR